MSGLDYHEGCGCGCGYGSHVILPLREIAHYMSSEIDKRPFKMLSCLWYRFKIRFNNNKIIYSIAFMLTLCLANIPFYLMYNYYYRFGDM